jgi:polar amino acid transport system substrate-binding protein
MKLFWKLGFLVSLLAGMLPVAWSQAPVLAPGGTLRAVINVGNPILAKQDAGGNVSGVSVDLAQALAQQLKVPLVLKTVTSARQAVAAVTSDEADVGFFAIDPLRAEGIAFTTPYVLIEGSYLVREDSPLRDNDEVDRASHRVVVGQGSAYDLFLTRHLQKAQLIRSATSPAVVDDFLRQGYEVAAGVRQQLAADAQRVGQVRLLPGRFMVIAQAMGLPKGRPAEAQQQLNDFVEAMKRHGMVGAALQRHAIEGATVAPAGPLR